MPDKPDSDDASREDRSFYIKVPETPQIGTSEAAVTEQQLLAKLKSAGPRAETLKPLAMFFSRVGLQEKAYMYLKMWMKYAKDHEELAECLLMSGQLAEQIDQPEHAAAYYQEALKHHPKQRTVVYFLHNNLAYCLNRLGRFEEAIDHCETALDLDATRANVYKNFGRSLEGLGRYGEAARLWLKAVHVDAADGRSLELLERMLAAHHAAVAAVVPDIDEHLEACRRAVAAAKLGRFSDWARGLTLN